MTIYTVRELRASKAGDRHLAAVMSGKFGRDGPFEVSLASRLRPLKEHHA